MSEVWDFIRGSSLFVQIVAAAMFFVCLNRQTKIETYLDELGDSIDQSIDERLEARFQRWLKDRYDI